MSRSFQNQQDSCRLSAFQTLISPASPAVMQLPCLLPVPLRASGTAWARPTTAGLDGQPPCILTPAALGEPIHTVRTIHKPPDAARAPAP